MAIDLRDPNARSRLTAVVRHAYEAANVSRNMRENLLNIYRDYDVLGQLSPSIAKSKTSPKRRALVNYFQSFVRGRMTTLAAGAPRWMVKARTAAGRENSFDQRINEFLNRYTEVLGLAGTFRNCALDSSFGRAVIKVITSVAPKGVSSPYAPRAFRISPDNFFIDQATLSSDPNDATFMGDIYLVPLAEAKEFEGFDPLRREELSEYSNTASGSNRFPAQISTTSRELFAEPMARLVDVYFPTSGVIATWECQSDQFSEISSREPLQVIPTPINPYEIFDSISVANSLEEFAPLQLIQELHFLANDMLHKAAEQARASKRNPIGKRGSEEDMHTLMDSPDNEPVFVDEIEDIGLYTLPGADGSLISLMQVAGQLLSSSAGNLEVALGQSAGASTARQTQAILGQINQVQTLDRIGFETFMANVGKKLATLAFFDESFSLEVLVPIPGTTYFFNMDWAPPHLLPRVAEIDSYHFEVVPYSTSFRSPQDRLAQLNQASQILMQWMTAAAQGAPINLEAVIESLEEAFDLNGALRDWWSGEKPSPPESAQGAYMSLAGPSQGSVLQYESNSPIGGGASEPSIPAAAGGVQ